MCAGVNQMIAITRKRIILIVWLLENSGKEISILQATREARALNYHATYTAFKDLAAAGYIRKKNGHYQVVNVPALIRQIAYAYPFRQKPVVGFFLGDNMTARMRKLTSLDGSIVFTLFAAAELLSPYVRTASVHAYVPLTSIQTWEERLLKANGRRAQIGEADTFLLPTDDAFVFRFSSKRGEFSIAPMALLLADLESSGGLAQEQAGRIMKEWLSSSKSQ